MTPFYVSLKPLLDSRRFQDPVNWKEIFGNDNPVELEIGFGNGEYLAKLSEERPEINFVGFEEYCHRIHRTLRKLSRNTSQNARIFRMDIRPALNYLFAPNSLQYIHCLYPPPWPKKSDIKHRLFTSDFLKLVNSRLILGGVLKIVTDHYPYMVWIQENIEGTGFSKEFKKIAASYDTKFEKKWVGTGQKEFYELLLTKKDPIDVPVKKEMMLKHYILDHFSADEFHMQDYSESNMAIVFKDILYDQKRRIAMIQVLVTDEHIFQNIRVVVIQVQNGWKMNLAEGTMMMPTAGVSKAMDLIYEAALKTSSKT